MTILKAVLDILRKYQAGELTAEECNRQIKEMMAARLPAKK